MELKISAIFARKSVRTYSSTPLTAGEITAIRQSFLEALPGPLGASPRFRLINPQDDVGSDKRIKIGTYGMIVGPRNFIVGVIERRSLACVDFGYCLEGIILRATELGLDTCWIGGAFDRATVYKALGATKHEFAPAVTPIGKAADRQALQERVASGIARGHSRLDPTQLFFEASMDGKIGSAPARGVWQEVLEAVRVGPSASNKQPWRLVLDRRIGDALHLVMHEDKIYNNMLGEVKLQELDMGIAMRHVEVALRALGIEGTWSRATVSPLILERPLRYISTFSTLSV